jgi:hypothetical protein
MGLSRDEMLCIAVGWAAVGLSPCKEVEGSTWDLALDTTRFLIGSQKTLHCQRNPLALSLSLSSLCILYSLTLTFFFFLAFFPFN